MTTLNVLLLVATPLAFFAAVLALTKVTEHYVPFTLPVPRKNLALFEKPIGQEAKS